MIDLVVVRHGESVRNHATLLAHQGQFDELERQLAQEDYEPGWPLTPQGWKQAKETGEYIKTALGGCCDIAYSSPYFRTLQTAKGLGLTTRFEQDWRLRERHWGDYQTLEPPYTVQRYLDDLAQCGQLSWRPDIPNGESIEDLVPQVRSFVQDRLVGLSNGTVILVTHGGTMKALQIVLQGSLPDKKSAVPNCSLLHYHIESFHPDGSATGDVIQECPWVQGCQHMEWMHFG